MDKDEQIIAYYPQWMKLISWLGVPALMGIAVWLILRPVWEEMTNLQVTFSVALGAAVFYQCAIGARALKYMNTKLHLNKEGLELHSSNGVTSIPWKNFGSMVEYSFATTTCFKDIEGNTIIYVFDNMEQLALIKSIIRRVETNA